MKHLIIIGARGYGREVYQLATELKGFGSDFVVKGFLDDKATALSGFAEYPRILGAVETYEPEKDDIFICALGEPKYKKIYANMILQKGGIFTTLIHPNASIGIHSTVGVGCIVHAYAKISCDVTVGDFVSFQSFSDVGHDVTIGNNCHVSAFAFLGGVVKVGNDVSLFTKSMVVPHKEIGDGVIVGAGSVVIANVKAGTKVFGNPAKKMEL